MLETQRPSEPDVAGTRRLDNLALIYQELLTVIVRLRSGRQDVSDPATFRAQVISTLKVAEEEARQKGYTPEDIRVATFAVVGFLDESILNSRNASFAEWLRRPLQQEMFGVQIAGEIFFRNIDRLLTREDSQPLADLLEIYELCLLLGFRGRYGVSDAGNLKAISGSITDKLRRIRGRSFPVPLKWAPHTDPIAGTGSDAPLRRLRWIAACVWITAIVLFLAYKLVLVALESGVIKDGAAAHF